MSLFGRNKKKKHDKEILEMKLETLERLGYKNRKKNIKMLQKYNGDSNLVVQKYRETAEQSLSYFTNSMQSFATSRSTNPGSQNKNKSRPKSYTLTKTNITNADCKTDFMTENEHIESALYIKEEIPIQITNPYGSMSSLYPQTTGNLSLQRHLTPSLNLKQSDTKLSAFGNIRYNHILDDDIEIHTEDEDDNDNDNNNNEPQPNIYIRSGSTLRREDKSAIFSSSRNILDDDYWSGQLDSVLREKINDYIDDHNIKDLYNLLAIMKVQKPESQMRIRRIFNELKWVRNDLKDGIPFKNNKIINSKKELEEEKEYSLEDDNDNDNDNDNEDENNNINININDDNKTMEDWINSDEYIKLNKLSKQIMGEKLKNNNNNNNNNNIYKNKNEIGLEASNELC
eukprot:335615_1